MSSFELPIHVDECHGLARTGEAVRTGVCLPRGLVTDVASLGVRTGVGAVPCQFRALAHWPEGSVKWLLVDALVSVGANERITLVVHGDNGSCDGPRLDVRSDGEGFEVDTGAVKFALGRRTGGLPTAVSSSGQSLLSERGSALRVLDAKGAAGTLGVQRFEVEEVGPIRASLRANARISFADGASLDVVVRTEFVAGSAALRVEIGVRNPKAARHRGGLWDLGDPSSVLLTDLSLDLFARAASSLAWYATDARDTREQDATPWFLYQDSSGGENWASDNHVDRNGRLTVSFKGFRVSSGEVGLRAQPCLKVSGAAGWVAATAADFWQNFPRALRYGDGVLSVGLFPAESAAGFELQGGEQKRHTVLLDFGSSAQACAMERMQKPLSVSVDPRWIERSGALHWFAAQEAGQSTVYRQYADSIIEGPHSFLSKREIIDEHGWRNFGDLFADHEAVRHQGEKPFISHYNNQYDFVQGAALQFLRSGDARWKQLMEDAARHVVDIDIYHTDEDRAAFSGGLFWHTDHHFPAATSTHRTYSARNAGGGGYGGGPSNEHNYTTGLTLHYYLTGDPASRESVLRLAEWVLAMDDGARTALAIVTAAPTGLASKTVDASYHGPGRGAGNSINALLDAWGLSGERRFMDKAEELIARCVHPADRIESLKLDEPEHRWSYLVFLQALCKYLEVKTVLGETGYRFHYARDTLLHYARWMMEHEVPYKDVLHKVLLPTETWPAHDIRKCHVLNVAAAHAGGPEGEAMRTRARMFFERCLSDVLGFDTAYFTRPRVILCVYGSLQAYFDKYRDDAPRRPHHYNFGEPQPFRSQRDLLKGTLTTNVKQLVAEVARVLKDRLRLS